MKRKIGLAVTVMWMAVGSAQDSLVLSIEEAIQYAIQHNKTLINSKYAIDKSEQKLKETITQGLPQASASLDYTDYLGAETSLKLNPMAPPAVIKFNPTSYLKASVSQLIFSSSYYVGIQLSKLGKALTEQSYQKDELNVKEQVIQSYYMILASERIASIIRENKANAMAIEEKTTHLANAGIIEQTDAKKLSVMVASVDNALHATERQIELGYNILRLQLGLDPQQPVKLASRLDEIAEKYILHASLADTFDVQNNPDFRLLSMQEEMARKTVDLKKTSYLPSIVAVYAHTEKIKKPIFDITPKDLVAVTLNIPIFSSGQRYTQVTQAKIDYKIAQNTKELVKEQLTIQEKQLRYNYNNLLEQYMNQKHNVEIAREVLEKMKLKYQQGLISSLELTSANNDYLTAESNYTSITLQLLNAELALRKINNKL